LTKTIGASSTNFYRPGALPVTRPTKGNWLNSSITGFYFKTQLV